MIEVITLLCMIIAGIGCYLLSVYYKIPYGLLLLAVGVVLGGIFHLALPLTFLLIVTVVAAIMVLFDLSEQVKFRHFDTLTHTILEHGFISLVLTFFIVPFVFVLLFPEMSMQEWIIAIIIIFFLCEVSYLDFKRHHSHPHARTFHFLEQESLVLPSLLSLVPFALLNAYPALAHEGYLASTTAVVLDLLISAGVGVLVGAITVKYIKKFNTPLLSFALLSFAGLSFVLAQVLRGNGILAVIVLGFFFGNTYIRQTAQVEFFLPRFSLFLEMIVYLSLGMAMAIIPSVHLLLGALFLFLIILFIRFLSLSIVLKNYSLHERMFLTLNTPKGAITIISLLFMVLSFSFKNIAAASEIPHFQSMTLTLFLVIIISHVVSWLIHLKSSSFHGHE